MDKKNFPLPKTARRLPIVKAQDVEFSMDEADAEDLEAMERAEAAEKRQNDI
jgi:hypothetical protein